MGSGVMIEDRRGRFISLWEVAFWRGYLSTWWDSQEACLFEPQLGENLDLQNLAFLRVPKRAED